MRTLHRWRVPVRTDDSPLDNGELWYRSDTNVLKASINSVSVQLYPPSNGTGVASAYNGYATTATFGNVTSYTLFTSGVTLAFTGPPSGRCLIIFGASDFYANNSIRTLMTYQMRSGSLTPGSGSIVVTADDVRSVVKQATTAQSCMFVDYQTVTPGTNYNIQMFGKMASSSAGSGGNAVNQYILMVPMF